jgi:hypothetical protein
MVAANPLSAAVYSSFLANFAFRSRLAVFPSTSVTRLL